MAAALAMADIADVEAALLRLVGDALPPDAYRGYRGWPTPAALEADLGKGISHLTVTAREGVGRVTTRYQARPISLPAVPVTLHAQNSAPALGNTVSFTGTAGSRHVAGVGVYDRAGVPDAAYCVACQAGETADQVAARIAAQIPGAVVEGASIRVPGAYLEARTNTYGEVSTELRRQDIGFQVCLWCPSPAVRDALGRKVDAALARAEVQKWLALPDGSAGWLRSGGVPRTTDKGSENLSWRRDFFPQVEFPTTITEEAPRMLFGGLSSRFATLQGGVAVLDLV